ncbi:hypothetical protein LZ31DRAFT_241326 [Colletotrichum somersetense]|nr:hypothetical protein LZ31DRAFT_241326 [Colletotrichum somersetense]
MGMQAHLLTRTLPCSWRRGATSMRRGTWTRTWAVSTRGTDANAWNQSTCTCQSVATCKAMPEAQLRRGWFTRYPSWCCRLVWVGQGAQKENRRRACRAEPGVRMPLYPLCISNVCGILLEANRWLESPYPHTTHHGRPPLTESSRWAPSSSSSSSGRSIAASLPRTIHQRPPCRLEPLGAFPASPAVCDVRLCLADKDALSFCGLPARPTSLAATIASTPGWAAWGFSVNADLLNLDVGRKPGPSTNRTSGMQ